MTLPANKPADPEDFSPIAEASALLGWGREKSLPQLMELLNNGLPWHSFETFRNNTGFELRELATFLDLPEPTLERRPDSEYLEMNDPERILRLAGIYASAVNLFEGDKEAAHQWLTSRVRGLNNAKPIDFAKTDYGAREVRHLIGRLEHGVFS